MVSLDFISMLHYCHSEFISESLFIEIPKQVRNDTFGIQGRLLIVRIHRKRCLKFLCTINGATTIVELRD